MKKRGIKWDIVELAIIVMVAARFVRAQAKILDIITKIAKDVTEKESAQSVRAQAGTKLLTLQIKV